MADDTGTFLAAADAYSRRAEATLLLDPHRFRGEGAIVVAGCFLGGSTTALAAGVEVFYRSRSLEPRKMIYSYGIFKIEEWTLAAHFSQGNKPGESFRHMYEKDITNYQNYVHIWEGDIRQHGWCGEPIEILFVDRTKHPRLVEGTSDQAAMRVLQPDSRLTRRA